MIAAQISRSSGQQLLQTSAGRQMIMTIGRGNRIHNSNKITTMARCLASIDASWGPAAATLSPQSPARLARLFATLPSVSLPPPSQEDTEIDKSSSSSGLTLNLNLKLTGPEEDDDGG